MKTSRNMENQNGFSLVEVLGVIIILSIIGILLFNIISSVQKQHSLQNEKNHDLQDLSYALKVMTKEIRRNPGTINVDSSLNILEINGVSFERSGDNLLKDSTILISDITDFKVNEIAGTITIELKSSSGEKVSTQIVER